MFRNIGNKLKVVAKVFFWIGFVLGIVGGSAGIVMGILAYQQGAFAMAILGIIGGILFGGLMFLLSWLAVMPLYGFGELVDNSSRFIKMLEEENKAEEDAKRAHARQPKSPDTAHPHSEPANKQESDN